MGTFARVCSFSVAEWHTGQSQRGHRRTRAAERKDSDGTVAFSRPNHKGGRDLNTVYLILSVKDTDKATLGIEAYSYRGVQRLTVASVFLRLVFYLPVLSELCSTFPPTPHLYFVSP
eukprot:superscaffoldBa00001000_g8449